MIYFFNIVFNNIKRTFSNYWYISILFILWLYRVDFISADGAGLAKGLQVFTIFGILLYTIYKYNKIISYSYYRTVLPIKSLLFLYTYALISTVWAFMPTFAFFLSFQNLVICFFLVWLFSQCNSFKSLEITFLSIYFSITLFELIIVRILYTPSIFIHYLSPASTSAICFSYCIAELLNMKINDRKRKLYLKGAIIYSLIVIITCTSSGANASAVFGFGMALFFSGQFLYSFLIVSIAVFLYLNPHLIDDILLLIMPGKTMETIESATGRSDLWDIMMKLANKKPVFGWGFGCIERAATVYGEKASPDAHNNYLGIYGSLGGVGIVLLIYHFASTIIYNLKRKFRLGHLGLFSATCCAMLNGYSYGFLSGKACSITVVYFIIVVLSFYYGRIKKYE